jgi:hypothetical protein
MDPRPAWQLLWALRQKPNFSNRPQSGRAASEPAHFSAPSEDVEIGCSEPAVRHQCKLCPVSSGQDALVQRLGESVGLPLIVPESAGDRSGEGPVEATERRSILTDERHMIGKSTRDAITRSRAFRNIAR